MARFLCFFFCVYISVFSQDPQLADGEQNFDEKQAKYFDEVKGTFSDLKNQKTPNFTINYTVPSLENYPKTFEALYMLFKRVMGIKADEKVFKCRLELYLWEKRADFVRFAATYEGFNASSAGGYFTITRQGWPRVNMPLETSLSGDAGKGRNYVVMFHEATHAMFSQYLSEVPLPTWLNEGIADYFAFSILEEFYPKLASNEKSKDRHRSLLKQRFKAGGVRSFRELFHQQGTAGGADVEGYALSWAITSLLMKNYKKQTIDFIRKVKTSEEIGSASGRFEGKTREELEQKIKAAQMNQKKALENIFAECFKMDIDKFGDNIYSQFKKSPGIFDKL